MTPLVIVPGNGNWAFEPRAFGGCRDVLGSASFCLAPFGVPEPMHDPCMRRVKLPAFRMFLTNRLADNPELSGSVQGSAI